ncbi:hypothetical protein ACI65C_001196 [Semiaphis heraclei]
MRAQRLCHPWQREDHRRVLRRHSCSLRTQPDGVAGRVVSVYVVGVMRRSEKRFAPGWTAAVADVSRAPRLSRSLAAAVRPLPSAHPSTVRRSLSLMPPLHRQTHRHSRARTSYRSPPPPPTTTTTGARGKRNDPSAELCSTNSVTVAARRPLDPSCGSGRPTASTAVHAPVEAPPIPASVVAPATITTVAVRASPLQPPHYHVPAADCCSRSAPIRDVHTQVGILFIIIFVVVGFWFRDSLT